ncbi:MAG: T9SS type A sorting domain-containing protein [bacterium]|nr:T9SS type A sorting domain-containing protein [bacterium]
MIRFALVLSFLAALNVLNAAPSATVPMRNIKPIDGTEQPTFQNIPDPTAHGPRQGVLDDLVGAAYVAGTTYYDYQHNGTAGKMVSVDELGFVHLSWTNGENFNSSDRHTYYNVWDPTTEQFTITNGRIDVVSRGGYVCGALQPDGFYFPAFHEEISTGATAHAAASIDLIAGAGAFNTVEPEYLVENGAELEIIWPKIARSPNGKLHVVSTENPLSGNAGDPQRIYYSRGIPQYNELGFGINIVWEPVTGGLQYSELDTVMVISPDVACSRHSDRVVIAWSKSRDDLTADPTQYNNDIVYIVSEDGGLNWSEEVNITNFIYEDVDCASGDTLICDADTFRAYTDMSVVLDENDNIHFAFMTMNYYALEGTISRYAGQIWHWGSDYGYMSPIMALENSYLDTNWADDLGDWQRALQRPNLSVDTETGHLYCAFVLADTANYSNIGIPMQDIWIAKSTNNGVSWSMAVNVTNTNTGQLVPVGESAHERDATLAETVTTYNGERYRHLSYVFDLDAGGAVGDNPTGSPTLNPVHYQRILVSDIPEEPLWNNQYPAFHVDSTDIPQPVSTPERPALPEQFTLYQNYPNPFNPSTAIQFDLARAAVVTLKVFNVLGEEVATLLDHAPLNAGAQIVNFDAGRLASGVYMYQLDAGGLTDTRKMVLMK